ncbi:MAG: DUF2147 domain-containing protein [Taibaiella sp.]|nr:DUF2147 domain-containing protein [Taibaiella sp.]
MQPRLFLRSLLFSILLLPVVQCVYAQDAIERLWYNHEKTAKIQVFKATDGKYYGKIVWLKEPNRDGKPKVDINNPNKAKRNDPIIGLQMLKAFKKDGDNHYEDGTIYDPKNGKTYSCKITYKGDHLEVRGYVGISMLGRTTVWTKAE